MFILKFDVLQSKLRPKKNPHIITTVLRPTNLLEWLSQHRHLFYKLWISAFYKLLSKAHLKVLVLEENLINLITFAA